MAARSLAIDAAKFARGVFGAVHLRRFLKAYASYYNLV
jgi:hypothetical protein